MNQSRFATNTHLPWLHQIYCNQSLISYYKQQISNCEFCGVKSTLVILLGEELIRFRNLNCSGILNDSFNLLMILPNILLSVTVNAINGIK